MQTVAGHDCVADAREVDVGEARGLGGGGRLGGDFGDLAVLAEEAVEGLLVELDGGFFRLAREELDADARLGEAV
ncbi:MAG: hypothetical protein IMZ46_08325 [Acidobacteria bacterium]|nr:hypothetical protein [Acidobacteriota bacterium]